jgi:hypothetical protein
MRIAQESFRVDKNKKSICSSGGFGRNPHSRGSPLAARAAKIQSKNRSMVKRAGSFGFSAKMVRASAGTLERICLAIPKRTSNSGAPGRSSAPAISGPEKQNHAGLRGKRQRALQRSRACGSAPPTSVERIARRWNTKPRHFRLSRGSFHRREHGTAIKRRRRTKPFPRRGPSSLYGKTRRGAYRRARTYALQNNPVEPGASWRADGNF